MIKNITKSVVRRGKREHDPEVKLEARQGIMHHRLNLPDPSAAAVARFAVRREGRRYADYTFYVQRDGEVYQLNDLGVITHHALTWSAPFIGVAWEGDFRAAGEHPKRQQGLPPTKAQARAGARLDAALCWLWGWQPSTTTMVGHTSKPHATRWPDKVCPGTLFGMNALRLTTTAWLPTWPDMKDWSRREIYLRDQGYTF